MVHSCLELSLRTDTLVISLLGHSTRPSWSLNASFALPCLVTQRVHWSLNASIVHSTRPLVTQRVLWSLNASFGHSTRPWSLNASLVTQRVLGHSTRPLHCPALQHGASSPNRLAAPAVLFASLAIGLLLHAPSLQDIMALAAKHVRGLAWRH